MSILFDMTEAEIDEIKNKQQELIRKQKESEILFGDNVEQEQKIYSNTSNNVSNYEKKSSQILIEKSESQNVDN